MGLKMDIRNIWPLNIQIWNNKVIKHCVVQFIPNFLEYCLYFMLKLELFRAHNLHMYKCMCTMQHCG